MILTVVIPRTIIRTSEKGTFPPPAKNRRRFFLCLRPLQRRQGARKAARVSFPIRGNSFDFGRSESSKPHLTIKKVIVIIFLFTLFMVIVQP